MRRKYFLLITCASVAFFVIFILALRLGHYPISLNEFFHIIKSSLGFATNLSEQELVILKTVFFEIRLPRILAAILIGASLSVSGAAYQGMFVNPLVSPSILGVLSGASFGAALGLIYKFPLYMIQLSAFFFGFGAVLLAIFIARFYGKGNNILMLILGGIISSSLFGAFVSVLKFASDPYGDLQKIVFWMMGSLSLATKDSIFFALPFMVISILIMLVFSKYIDVLSLGEDEAKALGVDVGRIRFFIIIVATLLSTLSVMLAGIVGWVGLVIPHIGRFIVGPNHIKLIPFCVILGASFVLGVDTISRSAFVVEVPLGILTSLVGIPVFIAVLSKYRLKRR